MTNETNLNNVGGRSVGQIPFNNFDEIHPRRQVNERGMSNFQTFLPVSTRPRKFCVPFRKFKSHVSSNPRICHVVRARLFSLPETYSTPVKIARRAFLYGVKCRTSRSTRILELAIIPPLFSYYFVNENVKDTVRK